MSEQAKLIQFLNKGKFSREWTEEAACIGKPLHWFFPPETHKSLYVGHSKKYIIEYEHKKMARGLKVCSTCPVKDKCRRDHKHEEIGVFYGTVPAERIKPGKQPNCMCLACQSKKEHVTLQRNVNGRKQSRSRDKDGKFLNLGEQGREALG